MSKRQLLSTLLLLALVFMLCSACNSKRKSNASAMDEEVFDWEKIRKDSFSQAPHDDPVPAETPTPEESQGPSFPTVVADAMVANGEITRYWPGDDLCVVYHHFVPDTFYDDTKLLCGVINSNGEFTVGLNEAGEEGNELWGWLCWAASYFPDGTRDINDNNIHHLGNNIFAAYNDDYDSDSWSYSDRPYLNSRCLEIYNANTNTVFWLGADDRERVYKGFHNSVIISAGTNRRGTTDLSLLFEDGTKKTKDMGKISTRDLCIGEYSDGLFYFEDGFYNVDLERVIELYVRDSDDAPRFVDGTYCFEVWKNEKLWSITIDTSGNMIGEPIEVTH